MVFQKPRLVIAALRGGSGKTVVTLGIAAVWRQDYGLRVVPFKKGPDYIDAGWLALASRHACYNLDTFLMKPDAMLHSFVRRSQQGDVSLIEGNRGLYDGVDVQGSFSTAELAKLLRAPVVLVLDATKVTRTAAALVLGCRHLDPEVNIAGVILNQVAGKRHEQVLRGAIERYSGVPVLGVIAKEKGNPFPERHLGLVPPQESDRVQEALAFAIHSVREGVDMPALRQIAQTAEPLGWVVPPAEPAKVPQSGRPIVIGVLRDSAFQFYYPENLEALEEQGAVLREISSFESAALPPMDALYIGGGFPETHLEVLARNTVFRESLRHNIEAGLPVYAECGGLMFLCRNILHLDQNFPMTGIFPFDVVLEPNPQGLGYTIMECVSPNPYYPTGMIFRGHEFHYSRLIGHDPAFPFIFQLKKGHGIVAGWDGLCYKNTLASYSHVHAVGNEHWAKALCAAALGYRQGSIDELWASEADPDQKIPGTCDFSMVG